MKKRLPFIIIIIVLLIMLFTKKRDVTYQSTVVNGIEKFSTKVENYVLFDSIIHLDYQMDSLLNESKRMLLLLKKEHNK